MLSPTSLYRPDLELVVAEFTPEFRGLIADRLMPILPSKKKAGPINKILGAYMAQSPGVTIKRAKRASAARGEIKSSIETYETARYTMEMVWDEEEEDDFLTAEQIEQNNALVAEAIVRNELEADVVSLLQNTTTFPLSGTTGQDGTTAWTAANLATMTPRADVHLAWRAHRPSAGNLPLEAYGVQITADHAQLISDCADFGTRRSLGIRPEDGRYSVAELVAYFGVGEVTIADSSRNTAALGVTASYSGLWSNTYAGLYVIPGRGTAGPQRGVGRIIQWDKQNRGNPVAIDTYYERANTTHVVNAEANWDAVVLNSKDWFLMDVA